MTTVSRRDTVHSGSQPHAYRLALLVAFSFVVLVAARWHDYQWDFYLAYGSGKDFLHGVSPYRGAGLSFYQAPLTLYFYGLTARLPFLLAYELWLVLKLCALYCLLWIWDRHFLKLARTWWMVVYFVLAYAGTMYADLVSGNVSIFEQLGLWVGFVALLRGHYLRFCVCLILVSQFKLTPMLFSVLLLLVPRVPRWKWFMLCWTGFGAVAALTLVLQPTLLRQFLHAAPTLDERGTQNPSTLAFLRDAADLLRGVGYSATTHIDEVAFIVVVVAISAVTLLMLRRHRADVGEIDPRVVIYVSCVAYCLLVPRLKSYSYIILLVPTLQLLRLLPRRTLIAAAMGALAAVVVFPHGGSLLPFHSLAELFYDYLPLAAAFAVWLGYMAVLGQPRALQLDAGAHVTSAPGGRVEPPP